MFALRYSCWPNASSLRRNYSSKIIANMSLSLKASVLNKNTNNNVVKEKVTTIGPTLKTTKMDYGYFGQLASNAQTGRLTSSDVEGDLLISFKQSSLTNENKTDVKTISDDNTDKYAVADVARAKYFNIKPSIPKKSFNLAAYVNESETLTNLVKRGVDLSKIDKNIEDADYLVKLDFQTGVQPYLIFLHKMGVSDADVGVCITRNPGLFRESIDDLAVRVYYLEMKKFSREAIARIISKTPTVLSQTVKQTDDQLGFLQKLFLLTGDEVRLVVTKHPKIAVWNQTSIADMKITFKDFLGFTDAQLKVMLLHSPKLLLSGRRAVTQRFDYLHNTIGFTHEDIVVWPQVLRTRVFIVRQRHEFLKSVGRDQFDPKKENYVSLKSLALGRDSDFCQSVAKVPVNQFNEFLKMH